jgi:hypothetical protein
MKKIPTITLAFLFVIGLFTTALAAEKITVKGQGSSEKNYTSSFGGQTPFNDGASTITQTISVDGVLSIKYALQPKGWLGAVSEHFQEDWSAFTGLQFKVAGGTKAKIRLELYDAHGVSYEFTFVDDSATGKLVTIPFTKFKPRTDWQPAGVDTEQPFSLVPVSSLNISPLEGSGTIYFSQMKLYK